MTRRLPVLLACLAILFQIVATPGSAQAHEIKPAIVTITKAETDILNVEIKLNIEALVARVGPEHDDTDNSPQAATYNSLRTNTSAELEKRLRSFAPEWLGGMKLKMDGQTVPLELQSVSVPPVGDTSLIRTSTVTLTATPPANASTLTWRYDAKFGSNILRVMTTSDKPVTRWLREGATSAEISLTNPQAASTWTVVRDYIVLGFTHIIPKGLDHILFVLGIYLLSTHWKPLLFQVTAFTLAHTITLALGLYGIVKISPNIVEPLIALSIAYVAIENIMTSKLHAWRTPIVFAFGLLHGLGFAGVLQELGLPPRETATALISFNVGVEFGQLAVIAIAFLATGIWFASKPWYRSRIVIPVSLVIAATGLYWTWERVSGALS